MTPFEFYFAFYGLLLGLSVAEVASGVVNAIGARKTVRFGLLTPLLALFVFFDISSFWIYAWGVRDTLTVGWGSMFLALFIALTYYFAAGLVFPRKIEEWPDLDEHFRAHKRWVIGGILPPNLIIMVLGLMAKTPSWDAIFWFGQLTYWPVLFGLLFSRSKRLDIVLLVIGLIGYIYLPFVGTTWILR